jgi:cytochrome c-type biogenesis protein CcmH
MNRRDFLVRLGVSGAAVAMSPALLAQAAATPQSGGPAQGTTSNLFNMDQDAALTVVRPRKPNARPSMTADERDTLEHQLRCQCGCTLDVYTCRTTDFNCQVSPAMHRDVMALVDGGYSAQEIIDAFVQTYGERVLMAPKREGFNMAGYIMPFAALGVGAAALAGVLHRMRQRGAATGPAASTAPVGPRATAEELARLDAAIRRDE